MVSVLEGRLTRTWNYTLNENKQHIITLFHDTITGLRSAMLDYHEIPNSFGNSSLFMESTGHRIFFSIQSIDGSAVPGFIEIKRSGWTSFTYRCIIQNEEINEITQIISTSPTEVFHTNITDNVLTKDEYTEGSSVVWYVVNTTRQSDKSSTSVHRRFKDFADMFSQVKQNFKGHHLRSSLPIFPEKTLKLTTDHMDPTFINDRREKLSTFLANLLTIPHVSEMTCIKAFLGLMDQVKEFSISFHVPTLGLSLVAPEKQSIENPAIVGIIQKPELCPGLFSGDSITKINGLPVAGSTFTGVVNRIKTLPRPIIIHFVQVIATKSVSSISTNV
mmetsp:Transcript_17466/g.15749  ORF Transcript_17466/g.15749 Transcript_17466/m.15749 type:complete len:332 (+) Transcript_17466:25-1020(+)